MLDTSNDERSSSVDGVITQIADKIHSYFAHACILTVYILLLIINNNNNHSFDGSRLIRLIDSISGYKFQNSPQTK
jgi:hypothetical protein